MSRVQTHLLQCCSLASELEHHSDFCQNKHWSAIDRSMTIWKSDLFVLKKMGILPNCNCVSTTVGLHHLDFNKTNRKKEDTCRNYARMLYAVSNKSWKCCILTGRSCVCIINIFDFLPHSTHTYILGNKRKRKEADYIFIHQHCCLSLPTTEVASYKTTVVWPLNSHLTNHPRKISKTCW